MIQITFNGKNVRTEASTLADLLQEQGFAVDSHVATAVNGQFVSKIMRETQTLAEGDSVEVVAPMQGG